MRFIERLALATPALLLFLVSLSGCASRHDSVSAPTVVRTAPPTKVEATVNSYFDLTLPPQPTPRKLAIGAPEASKCSLFGRGGRHAGWLVPVIHDTSPPSALTASSTPGKLDKDLSPTLPKGAPQPKANTSGTTANTNGTTAARSGPVSLSDVSITGTRYYFWFSGDTISAVTRQADVCP
jgi:hypothetical protein